MLTAERDGLVFVKDMMPRAMYDELVAAGKVRRAELNGGAK